MPTQRLQISPGLAKILDYPRFGPVPRMLILSANYFFEKSWVRAAKSLGWEATTAPSAMTGAVSREEIATLFQTIGEFRPDFILASNFAGMDTGGLFANFYADARIPYVSWFTDPPRMILIGREDVVTPYTVAATWERACIPQFEARGYEHVHYMPLATDPDIFHGAPSPSHLRPLSFVGNSMVGLTNAAIEKHAHLPAIRDAIADAFDVGRITRVNYTQGLDAMLGCELTSGLNPSERRNAELLINYEATRRQRAALGTALAPLGLEVRGDPGWRNVLENVEGEVGYFDDLGPYYQSTAINLNSTSMQMEWAVNQRVFDCPAAGGFLITDDQEDMARHFDLDSEAAVYSSLDELVALVERYRAAPEERAAIVRNAQRRILATHTHAHRLADLLIFLKARFT